ncbi:MAG: hypothetical protein ACKOFJ_08400 [Actinomycetota bacterium]
MPETGLGYAAHNPVIDNPTVTHGRWECEIHHDALCKYSGGPGYAANTQGTEHTSSFEVKNLIRHFGSLRSIQR